MLIHFLGEPPPPIKEHIIWIGAAEEFSQTQTLLLSKYSFFLFHHLFFRLFYWGFIVLRGKGTCACKISWVVYKSITNLHINFHLCHFLSYIMSLSTLNYVTFYFTLYIVVLFIFISNVLYYYLYSFSMKNIINKGNILYIFF